MKQCQYCGKEMKAGIRLHENSCKKRLNKNSEKIETKKKIEDSLTANETKIEEKSNKIQEINLMSEFENKKTVIQPSKKQEEKTEEFQCGSCQEVFTKRHKFCPSCGIEFE